jgi:2-C-methyl-D-erythritol 4-phosphate cytidylyltransferase
MSAAIDAPANDVSVLIAAAGDGTRLGLGPKALLTLGGETLLERVLRTARAISTEIVVAAPPGAMDACRAVAGDDIGMVSGGSHRCDSFSLALARSRGAFIVLLDVSRPFVSVALARAVLAAAREGGAAGAFVRADVPAALVDAGGRVTDALPSGNLRLPQMPQAFARAVIERLFAKPLVDPPQTVWQLALRHGVSLAVVDGEPQNMKITHPFDWAIAQNVIVPLLQDHSPP